MSAPDRLAAALADRYVIERELGAGGMATVYLAHDVRHDRHVALKVLRPELSAILGAERFLAEIKTTANLQHPHILGLFDSGEADGHVFYVMPYVEGESLRDRLTREKQLPVEDAVRIAREVADALEYAHQRGVIHRDIKPENILLHGGHAQVADFGIALAVSRSDGGTRMTETGMSLGTPHYMAPEQAMGEREITPRVDIYALGCVLYEMLTAEPPFTGATAQAIIARVMTEEPRSLTLQRRTIPPNVDAATQKALAKLPADRFATAREFSEALGKNDFALPTTQAGRGAAQPAAPPSRRERARRALPWALAALALAGGAWGWLRPAPPREVVRYSLGLPDSQALAAISDRRLAISPDGRTLVYVGPAGSGTQLWLRHRNALTATPLAGSEGAFNPAFSPDGSRLAFVSGSPRALRVLSLAGGTPSVLTDSLVDRGGVSWGYDGYIYYDGHLTGDGIARIRAAGGRPEIATRPRPDSGESYHIHPFALPNGKGLLFSIRRRMAGAVFDVGAADLRTGRIVVLARGGTPVYAGSGHLLYLTSQGSLMAAPFDQDRLRITGEAVEVASGVALGGSNNRGDVVMSRSGTLAYVMGASGSSATELVWVTRAGVATVVDPAWHGRFVRPALSPEGRRLAVEMAGDIWVKQLDRGPSSKLTFDGRSNYPVWTPDGRRVVFLSNEIGATAQAFVVPADGSSLPVRLRADGDGIGGLAISHDGNWLLFTTHNDLFAARMAGDTARRELVVSPFIDVAPALSPDGRWLAYMSDESGSFEVYVRPFPGTRAAKRQVSEGGGMFPRWSANGRELIYQRLTAQGVLVSAPVLPGPGFTVGESKDLFSLAGYSGSGLDTPWFDVSADGQRFLMVRRVGGAGAREEVIVVENAFEVLRGKAPR